MVPSRSPGVTVLPMVYRSVGMICDGVVSVMMMVLSLVSTTAGTSRRIATVCWCVLSHLLLYGMDMDTSTSLQSWSNGMYY